MSDCMSGSDVSRGDEDFDECQFSDADDEAVEMDWPEDQDESFASASHLSGIYLVDRRLTQHQQLTADMIEMEQSKAIKKVMDLTELSSHTARQLLQEMRWSFEALAEKYYEDSERLLSRAGVCLSSNAEAPSAIQHRASSGCVVFGEKEEAKCQVCFDSFVGQEATQNMTALTQCGHVFCNSCWVHHLEVQIRDEGQAARIHCPGELVLEGGRRGKCNILVDEAVVETLLKAGPAADAALLSKYRKRLVEGYVNDNPCIKWCTAKDCTNAVQIEASADLSAFRNVVACSAGHYFCFRCLEEPHSPADCSDVKRWFQKCKDDSETCNWLQANTKDCPKCKVAINKDGGCNHMHCKQCDHHFCWICLSPFEHTTYQHTCNKYVENEAAVNSSRAALERYMHHYERFMNHAKSRSLESKLHETCLAKMDAMQEKGNKTYMEVQFIKEATEILILARQTLQWTYVVGYYQPAWLERNIFEMNQTELEGATEKLSGMLEQEDMLRWCHEDHRVELINHKSQVKSRLDRLYDHLEDWRAAALDAEPPPAPAPAPAAGDPGEAGEAAPSPGGAAGRRPNKRGRAPAKRGSKV